MNADQTDDPQTSRPLGRAAPVAAIATVVPIIGALTLPGVGLMVAPWLRAHGWAGVVMLMISLASLGALTLSPTYTSSLVAGWTFGFARGLLAATVGLVAGAILCYLLARRMARERVAETFAQYPKWEIVRRALVEEKALKALWIVFLLRLSPVLPFGTTNVLLATTGVPLRIYALGTVLGLTPRMALVALAGARAERLDFDSPQSWWVLAGGLVATGVCVLVLALIGKRALDRTMNPGARADAPADVG